MMPSSAYTNAVEAALAMAAAYETKEIGRCKPKRRKKAPPAPPLAPNKPKTPQQTHKERRKKPPKREPRRRETQKDQPSLSSTSDSRPKPLPPRRLGVSEDRCRQRITSRRRATGAASAYKSRSSPEVVDLLSSSSSSSGSSIDSRSRSCSVSSLSSLSSLSSSDGEDDSKLNDRTGNFAEHAAREFSSEGDTSKVQRKGVDSHLQLKRKIAAKQAAVNRSRPSNDARSSAAALTTSMTRSASSSSSSPASPPRLLQARKSVATPCTASLSSRQGHEEDEGAFGRFHGHKSVSACDTTSGDTSFTSSTSAYAGSASSSPSPSPRKKRRVSAFFNTEKVSLDELQAQERELAWIRSQRNQTQNRSRTSKTATQKRPEAIDVDSQYDTNGASGALDCDHRNHLKKDLKPSADGVCSSTLVPNNIICHPTSYRGIFLDEAPLNLLSVQECTAPFESDCDKPLTFYDATGTLASQCSFLKRFGKPSQCISSVFPGMAVKPQSDVTRSVSAVVTAHLPIVRRCYRRKVRVLLKEARKKIVKYQAALEKFKADRDHGVTWHLLSRSPVEKHAVRQLKSVQHSCSLSTGRVSFQIGHGDDTVQEKSVTSLIQINRLEEVQPLRRYTTSIGLRANYRVEDNPFLHYASSSRPIDGTGDGEKAVKYGLRISSVADEEVVEFVLRLVVGRLGDSDQVFRALKSELGFSQSYTVYSELKKVHDLQQHALSRLRRMQELISDGERGGNQGVVAIVKLMELSSLSSTMRAKSLTQRLQQPIRSLVSNILDSLVENSAKSTLGLRTTGVYNELAPVYGASFCRMCYSYACQEHGGDHPLPARRVDPAYPRVRSISGGDLCSEDEALSSEDEVMRLGSKGIAAASLDHNVKPAMSGSVLQAVRRSTLEGEASECNNREGDIGMISSTDALADPSEFLNASHVPHVAAKMQIFLSMKNYCSQQCWKMTDRCDPADHVPMSPSELGVVRKLRDTMGDNSCLLAAVLGSVSCAQLNKLLQKHERSGDGGQYGQHLRKWKQGKRSNGSNQELVLITRHQRLQDRGATNHEYVPCLHEGTCDSAGCTCMQRDHMCEKACACSRDCPNRFEGCKCLPGECRTAACRCFAALRECDADVCLSCGAVELAMAAGRGSTTRSGSVMLTCGNINVIRRYHQKLGMSFSSIHGYGVYAHEAVAANEFVYEYTGAMISQDEAERRGRIYDKKEMSYLFDLNEDAVLDALRRGNKSKFINHDGNTPNCTAKVTSVCGVHHISIRAVRDIAIGEELGFDYGYKRGVGPDWSQHRVVRNEPS